MAFLVLFFVLLFGYTYQQESLVTEENSFLLKRKDATACVDQPACALLPGICSISDVAYIQSTCPDKCGLCPTPVCSPSFCQNSGVCVMVLGKPKCACPDDVSGVHCETDTRDCPTNPCIHGGTCSRGNSGTFMCSCAPGFKGFLCETEVKTTTTTATTATTTSRPTPLDGGWGTWGSYGACSKTCGRGTQGRHRACDTPSPAHGGKACVGDYTSSQTCQSGSCPGCASAPADINFLVDSSGSLGSSNFHKQLDFIASFTDSFAISSTGVRVGVTTFSTDTHNQFWMNDHMDAASLKAAIQAIPYKFASTNTGLGLKLMREEAFTAAHGGRSGVKNILIVTTDGQSTKPAETAAEAALLHKENINVYSIGIGTNVDTKELEIIASSPANVYTVSNFDMLAGIQASLKQNTCLFILDSN